VELAQALGLVGIKYITLLQNICFLIPSTELLELFVTAAAIILPILGLGTAKFRNAVDCCFHFITGPITLAYVVMTLVYRWHLKATMHTWLAMRGKTALLSSSLLNFKKGTTEATGKKSSSAATSSPQQQPVYPTQLAVASLLFMPCVLTLPTTAWFYAFWSAVEVVCYGVPVTAAAGAVYFIFKFLDLDNDNEESTGVIFIFPNVVDVLHKWVQGLFIYN
jgi:hypothetical protein